jgi:saccharopine dehydrogenase-like NADP-dependent oxidoreductase
MLPARESARAIANPPHIETNAVTWDNRSLTTSSGATTANMMLGEQTIRRLKMVKSQRMRSKPKTRNMMKYRRIVIMKRTAVRSKT